MPTPKVLLVDDVNMFLELEKSFLKLSPVRILSARDGAEALEVIKKERPDLVFMDLNMPRMNGAECCAAVKNDPELKGTPIVIITTAGKQEDRELCQKAGCDDFITKPVERKSFLEMARRYLHNIERRETRVPCKINVTVTVHSGTFTAESCDISEKGIYLALEQELAHGTAVTLKFSLPDEKKTVVETRGRVVWINGRNDRKKVSLPEGVGIEFVSLPEQALEGIRDVVTRRGAPL